MEILNQTPSEGLVVDAAVRCDPCLAFDNTIAEGIAFGMTAFGVEGILCQKHADDIGVVGLSITVDAGDPEATTVPAAYRYA